MPCMMLAIRIAGNVFSRLSEIDAKRNINVELKPSDTIVLSIRELYLSFTPQLVSFAICFVILAVEILSPSSSTTRNS